MIISVTSAACSLKLITHKWLIFEAVLATAVIIAASYSFARYMLPWMIQSKERFSTLSILSIIPLTIMHLFLCFSLKLDIESAIKMGSILVGLPSAMIIFLIVHFKPRGPRKEES
jgi:Kef-type K+ transport system membrane component KefB